MNLILCRLGDSVTLLSEVSFAGVVPGGRRAWLRGGERWAVGLRAVTPQRAAGWGDVHARGG